eukprot:TRINITY_DN7119_c0_g1_i1.p1 TRINITY_DN7119_c0_g1~~TRINITY_DN7119_c0_g1_i1.p1  ORF type:complete len:551 (+),score=111.21 TRINITY_DN7119_c0_g1_i1:174-1826(+)
MDDAYGTALVGALAFGSWLVLPAAAQRGDPSCWMGDLQFESCCLPAPGGKAECWEGLYTYERCCSEGGAGGFDINNIEDISLLGGCELNIFQEFKGRAGAWYKEGVPNLVLFHEFTYIHSRFDSMYKSCAPAALTAALLKLEAIYYEEDARWTELLAFYLEKHHEAVAEGRLLESHHRNGWPLLEGIRKVNALRSLRGASSVKPPLLQQSTGRAAVDVVVCYCGRGERIDWLRAFQKMPWRSEDRTEATRRNVALKFYHKCPAPDTNDQIKERQQLLATWGDIFQSVEVRYVHDKVRADDCSAYFAYVVDYYDDLPDFTVFLHADAPEHIPTIDLLFDAVFAAGRGYLPKDAGFIHLAHNYVNHGADDTIGTNLTESGLVASQKTASYREHYEFSELWKRVFASSVVPSIAEGDIASYCCVQFMVRRERILQRPRRFYERTLEYFGETAESYHALFPAGRTVWAPDTRGRTPCQLAMYIWHVLFGEDLRLPRRHRDSRLPLFIRMLNIEVEAIHEEGAADGSAGSFQMTAEATADATYYRLQTLFESPEA